MNFFKRRKPKDNGGGDFLPRSANLNLGCGTTVHPAWDNFDLAPNHPSVRPIDLLQPLPFADGSYAACYASHVVEHLQRSYVPVFLREVRRILRPGGIVRIVVPDLEAMARQYLIELEAAAAGGERELARHEWMTLEIMDQMTRSISGGFMGRLWYSRPLPARDLIERRLGHQAMQWIEKHDGEFSAGATPLTPEEVYEVPSPGAAEEEAFRKTGEIHRWAYDRVSLGRILQQAGFVAIRVCGAHESGVAGFSTFHLDTDESGAVRKPDSLFLEAAR